MSIGVRRSFGIGAEELAAASRAALEVPFVDEAELWIARPNEDAIALGAFQRASSLEPSQLPVVRRGSGGPAVRIGKGTLWVALLLPRVDALVACDEARIVNRYVRPLLRALTKCGALAHFFGRDWVSVKHRPAGWIGFAHERGSGRAVVEAFIARETRFDLGPRAAYLGKEPGTLEEIVGTRVEEGRLAEAIVAAYAGAYGRAAVDRGAISPPPDSGGGREGGLFSRGALIDSPWSATVDEVIGLLGAGPDANGQFRIGGDLLVSRDALASLETSLKTASDDDIDALVDAALGAPGVAIDGVASLRSVSAVIREARELGRTAERRPPSRPPPESGGGER
jgi:hypothetical protein